MEFGVLVLESVLENLPLAIAGGIGGVIGIIISEIVLAKLKWAGRQWPPSIRRVTILALIYFPITLLYVLFVLTVLYPLGLKPSPRDILYITITIIVTLAVLKVTGKIKKHTRKQRVGVTPS